jgi:tRNA A58 N-methylase Trm61
MIARYVLNKAHVYSEEQKAEFLENAKRTAKEFEGLKISDELKALMIEQDKRSNEALAPGSAAD